MKKYLHLDASSPGWLIRRADAEASVSKCVTKQVIIITRKLGPPTNQPEPGLAKLCETKSSRLLVAWPV